jgi:uncharacterized protein YbjT (DUF2867 family)
MADRKIIAVLGATGAQGGGLVRAILADRDGGFAVRAVTRKVDSDAAKALAAQGAEVVAGDSDDPAGLDRAFAGAYGAFCVTNFWEHFSAEREGVQAANMARASRRAGLSHVVWSTLEDTRLLVPLEDTRLPTLQGRFKCPHFDAKGQMDATFAAEAAPTSYLLAAFYWDNLIHFGMGPRKGADGALTFAMPLGGAKLPGIAAGDIGRCAYGIFKRGPGAAGQRFGVSGENLSGEAMAAKLSRALGQPVKFQDVPFDVYRGLGFPGAEDLGNMFQYQAIAGEAFQRSRDPKLARELHPQLQDFDAWLAANASRIPIG